jgi:hypothetical protein
MKRKRKLPRRPQLTYEPLVLTTPSRAKKRTREPAAKRKGFAPDATVHFGAAVVRPDRTWWWLLAAIVVLAIFASVLAENRAKRIDAVESITKATIERADSLALKVEALRSRMTQAEDRLPILSQGRVEFPEKKCRVR